MCVSDEQHVCGCLLVCHSDFEDAFIIFHNTIKLCITHHRKSTTYVLLAVPHLHLQVHLKHTILHINHLSLSGDQRQWPLGRWHH